MRLNRLTLSLFFLSSSFFFCPYLGISEELKDFMQSPDFAKYKKPPSEKKLLSNKWFNRGSNYEYLFREIDGPLELNNWLGVSATGFKINQIKKARRSEFVGLHLKLSSPTQKKIDMHVLVPHPLYVGTQEVGLMPAFSDFEPPKLKISYVEEINTRGLRLSLYQKESGDCSLLLRMNKGAIINLSVDNCQAKPELLSLIAKLDLERLNIKLNS